MSFDLHIHWLPGSNGILTPWGEQNSIKDVRYLLGTHW